MITDKDIFNRVKQHLLQQNEKSTTVNGTCAYRGVKHSDLDEVWMSEFGTSAPESIDNEPRDVIRKIQEINVRIPKNISCAVGCIIDNDVYNYEIESKPADHPEVINAVILSNPDWNIEGNSVDMLLRLQSCHDEWEVSKWPEILRTFIFDDYGTFIEGGIVSDYWT